MKLVKIELHMKIFFIPKLRLSLNIPCLKDMRKRYFHIQLVGIETHTSFWKVVQKYLLNFKACTSQDLAIPLYLTLKKCLHPRRQVQNIQNSVV